MSTLTVCSHPWFMLVSCLITRVWVFWKSGIRVVHEWNGVVCCLLLWPQCFKALLLTDYRNKPVQMYHCMFFCVVSTNVTVAQGRTDAMCMHRWKKHLDPVLIKGCWTKDEDELVGLSPFTCSVRILWPSTHTHDGHNHAVRVALKTERICVWPSLVC